jgi:hypothetical protein
VSLRTIGIRRSHSPSSDRPGYNRTDQTLPSVLDGGSVVASGFPQYAWIKSFVPATGRTFTQTVDVPFVFHSSISNGSGVNRQAAVNRRSAAGPGRRTADRKTRGDSCLVSLESENPKVARYGHSP